MAGLAHQRGNERWTGLVALPDMANIASDARPAIIGACLLVLVLAPWHHGGHQRITVSLDAVKRPPVIVAMDLEGPDGGGFAPGIAGWLWRSPDVLEPPAHPDAQAWPRGMVIRPPAFPDAMAITAPTVLDRLLSALLAPWASVPS